MRFCDLIKREALIYPNRHIAGKHFIKKVPCHFLASRMITDMGVYSGSRQLQRSFRTQYTQIERRHFAGCVAKGNHHPQRAQTVQRPFKRILSDSIHDSIYTFAIGQFAHLYREITITVIQAMGRAMIQRQSSQRCRLARLSAPISQTNRTPG